MRERSMTKRFLIDLAYTDDELAAHARIVDSEWRQGADHLAWGVYGSGFAISLIGAPSSRFASTRSRPIASTSSRF